MCLFIIAGRQVSGASIAQEKSIWTLWNLQTNEPARHEAIAAAGRRVQETAPDNPLLPVAQGLSAWHSLRMGKTNEAAAAFEAMAAGAPTTPMASAGAEMGRRWLTRLDREKVRGALAVYYRDAIEYPVNLQPLKKMTSSVPLPLTDRWGTPWQYQLAAFNIIKGARAQRYLLQSQKLGQSSDLAEALDRLYAGRILLQPVSLTVTGSGAENVVLRTPGDRPETILLSESGQAAGVTLAYIGAHILILSDGDHWRVVLKPAR